MIRQDPPEWKQRTSLKSKGSQPSSTLPLIPFFPFVRVLLQLQVRAPDLLCHILDDPPGGVQRPVCGVIVGQLLAQIFHVPDPLFAQSEGFVIPEKRLETRGEENSLSLSDCSFS